MTTRRDFLARAVAGTALPSTASAAEGAGPPGGVTGEELTALIQRTERAEVAFMRGDMPTYLGLIEHADDYTLLPPFGGPATRGFDRSPARLARLARFFRSGAGRVEVVQTYASGALVVLVLILRLHGEVGGLPEQPWTLRVTQVYRRERPGWRLVHRHADPLARDVGVARAAALARE